jgi:hypothetical protein
MRAPARVHDWVRLDCAGSADLDWVGSTARSTIVSPLASRCRSPSRPAFVRTSPRLYREADRDGTDHPLILLFFFCPDGTINQQSLCLSSSSHFPHVVLGLIPPASRVDPLDLRKAPFVSLEIRVQCRLSRSHNDEIPPPTRCSCLVGRPTAIPFPFLLPSSSPCLSPACRSFVPRRCRPFASQFRSSFLLGSSLLSGLTDYGCDSFIWFRCVSFLSSHCICIECDGSNRFSIKTRLIHVRND